MKDYENHVLVDIAYSLDDAFFVVVLYFLAYFESHIFKVLFEKSPGSGTIKKIIQHC